MHPFEGNFELNSRVQIGLCFLLFLAIGLTAFLKGACYSNIELHSSERLCNYENYHRHVSHVLYSL